MNTSERLEQRIVDVMQGGAQLILHCTSVEDCAVVTSAVLERNGQGIRIDVDRAERIRLRPDIRPAYPGFFSDFGPRWREVYEHVDTPVERWVVEQ